MGCWLKNISGWILPCIIQIKHKTIYNNYEASLFKMTLINVANLNSFNLVPRKNEIWEGLKHETKKSIGVNQLST